MLKCLLLTMMSTEYDVYISIVLLKVRISFIHFGRNNNETLLTLERGCSVINVCTSQDDGKAKGHSNVYSDIVI